MEQNKHATPWYRQPIWLGLLGLALMIGGYKVSTYLPEKAAQNAKVLDDLDRMRQGDHADLAERLQQMRPAPEFRWLGRTLLLGGGALFLTAAVLMVRRPAATQEQPAEEEQTMKQK